MARRPAPVPPPSADPIAPAPHKRTRLDPDLRREQILDAAARLIIEDGLTAVSMERIARKTGVSKALIYAYFANHTVLMQELLARDMRRIQRELRAAADAAQTFEDMVRKTVAIALAEIEERGLLTQRLLSEPAVAAAIDAQQAA